MNRRQLCMLSAVVGVLTFLFGRRYIVAVLGLSRGLQLLLSAACFAGPALVFQQSYLQRRDREFLFLALRGLFHVRRAASTALLCTWCGGSWC